MEDEIWTTKRILAWIESYLADHGDPQARLSSQWLVADALGVDRMHLFLDFDRPLSEAERSVLRDYTKRRGAGEPLQYITGTTDFRYITVKVREGVLIPRPETEVLVSEALTLLPPARKPQDEFDELLISEYRALSAEGGAGVSDDYDEVSASEHTQTASLLVADICTGSGCIACSIAHERSDTRVVATDISPAACELARENASSLGLADRVDVVECDLGQGIDDRLMGAFDLVVSNPPYVPSAVLATLDDEVTGFEPALALDGGADGLDVFRRLVAWAHQALRSGGGLAVELHETCLDAAAELAGQSGFGSIRIASDLAGRPRVLCTRKL